MDLFRFQHSRIRPHFSGCGRSVVQTLDDIREGNIKPEDIPPIQVLMGPVGDDGERWYFSLNNRRLWVLKRCREEGLLPNNLIRVRVRAPKSIAELERYSIQNCSLEATFMRETLRIPDQIVTHKGKAMGKNEQDFGDVAQFDFVAEKNGRDSSEEPVGKVIESPQCSHLTRSRLDGT